MQTTANSYLENALEVQFGGAHGVSGQQIEGRLAMLVAHVGHGAVLQQQLRVLGLLQHACKVQGCVAHGALNCNKIQWQIRQYCMRNRQ